MFFITKDICVAFYQLVARCCTCVLDFHSKTLQITSKILTQGYRYHKLCKKWKVLPYMAVAGSGKVGPVNQVNHNSWVAIVTPTDRPKSVRNRCLIELFCGVVCVVILPF